ncbi:hypothetical protein D3C87_1985050 [compost metagenome]
MNTGVSIGRQPAADLKRKRAGDTSSINVPSFAKAGTSILTPRLSSDVSVVKSAGNLLDASKRSFNVTGKYKFVINISGKNV